MHIAKCVLVSIRVHMRNAELLKENQVDSPEIDLEPSLCFQACVEPRIDELDALTQTPIEAHEQGRICSNKQCRTALTAMC